MTWTDPWPVVYAGVLGVVALIVAFEIAINLLQGSSDDGDDWDGDE